MYRIVETEPVAQSDGCSVYHFRNETGDGTITMYDVFPGVSIALRSLQAVWVTTVRANSQ